MASASLELLADSSQIRTATRDLDRLSASGAKAESAQKGIESTAKRTNAAFSSVGRSAGQAGIQIQQFVGQIQGGQSAMLALSQQGADLGFVLGAPLLGAVVGIGASLVSFLIPALTNSADETEELAEKLRELGQTQLLTAEQAAFLSDVENDSIKSNKEKQKELEKEIAIVKAGIANQERVIANNTEQEDTIKRIKEANEESNKSLRELQARYGLLTDEIDKSERKLKAYDIALAGNQTLTDDQKKSVDSVIASYKSQIIALQGGAQAAEVYALAQRVVIDGTEEELPKLISLVNQKYELKRAQEEAAEAARQETQAQREYNQVLDQIFRNQERKEAQSVREQERQLQSFESLKQQIALQESQILLDNEQYELRRNLLALGEGASESQITEITALTEQMQALRFEAELLGPTLENSLQNIGLSALDSLSQGLANAITEGESLRDVIGGIANSILNELLTAVIRYAVGSAAQALIGQTTATTAAVASGTAIAAAYTPAAIAANIATLGGAATAAAATAATAIPTMASLISASSIAGFESGGYTGNVGTKQVAGVVHGQEFVMNAAATRRNRGALEAMNNGQSVGGDTYVNVTNNATNSDVSTQERTDAQGNRVIDIVVANINQRGRIHKAMTQTTTASNRI